MTASTIIDVARAIHANTGLDPLTPAWEATLRAFYGLELRPIDVELLAAATNRSEAGIMALSGTGKPMAELWCRVGRRGRKSFSAALLGVFEAIAGGHERFLVSGEQGLIAIISKDSAGSQVVCNFAAGHARALGIETNWSSIGAVRVLELAGCAFAIACLPCNARAPRGFAVPVIIADEVAHWQTDGDEYVNSDEAVLGAIKPAAAQFPNSKLIAISSPLGHLGMHYEAVQQNLGDDAAPGVLAVQGPTWTWNSDISEARTHEIERDPDTHAREFGAIVAEDQGTAFLRSDVEKCFAPLTGTYSWGTPFLCIDPASRSNTFAWLVCSWGQPAPGRVPIMAPPPPGSGLLLGSCGVLRDSGGNIMFEPMPTGPILKVGRVGGFTGEQMREIGMPAVIKQLTDICKWSGITNAFTDSFGDDFLGVLFGQQGLKLRSFHQTAQSKHEAVMHLRAMMRDGQLSVCQHAQMRQDLLTYPRRIVGGGIKYGGSGTSGHHFDMASALLILAHTMIVSDNSGLSPAQQPFRVEGAPRRYYGGVFQASGR